MRPGPQPRHRTGASGGTGPGGGGGAETAREDAGVADIISASGGRRRRSAKKLRRCGVGWRCKLGLTASEKPPPYIVPTTEHDNKGRDDVTAEIAILNKSAVALATDSAVTISSGAKTLKIFESADKLFELSSNQPIGVMVYNGMQFLGIPLEHVVKSFRHKKLFFDTTQEAAEAFLQHLASFVDGAPDEEIGRSISDIILPLLQGIEKRVTEGLLEALNTTTDVTENIEELRKMATNSVIQDFEFRVSRLKEIDLLDRSDRKVQAAKYKSLVEDLVKETLGYLGDAYQERLINLGINILKSEYISNSRTGIVIAGFGEEELFPTLVGYEIDGLFNARVR